MAPRSRRRLLATVGSIAVAGCTLPGSNEDDTPEDADAGVEAPDGDDAPASSEDDGSDDRNRTDHEDGPADDTPTDDEPNTGTETADEEATEEDDDEADDREPDWEAPTDAPALAVETEPLVRGLEVPWDLAFGPEEVFFTERAGYLTRIDTAALLDDEPIDAGDLGDRREWPAENLLGVAVHPDYPAEPSVYVAVHADGETSVERFDPDDPANGEPILEGIEGDHTIGTRLAFGPEGDLWVTAGTAEDNPAQDPSTLGGTVLRLEPDGEPSPANPGLEDPRVFSYGHRNPQGVAFLPDGTPLASDHGPVGRDEIRRLVPGGNAGWPTVQGGPDDPEYDTYGGEYEPPLVNTGPDETWAPGGCTFYEGKGIPSWRNRLLVATLYGRHLVVVTLTPPGTDPPPLEGEVRRYDAGWLDDTHTATAHRLLESDLGRLRGVVEAPDGSVLVLTSNRDGMTGEDEPFPLARDDAIVRLRE